MEKMIYAMLFIFAISSISMAQTRTTDNVYSKAGFIKIKGDLYE